MNEALTELTDAQVLTQLKKKRIRLLLEVERVDMAIKAFSFIKEKEVDALEMLAFDTDVEVDLEQEVETDLKLFKNYNPDHSNEQKIFWALHKMSDVTAAEIADLIMHQDGNLKHRTAVVNAITYSASRLFKAGKIDAVKRGRINYYKLKN